MVSLDFYEYYVFEKQCRVSFSTGMHSTKGTIDYIHFDLWGSTQVTSNDGAVYLVTFIDDFSKKF